MRFLDVASAYEDFSRRLAASAASRIDAMMETPRRIRTETSNFVLGADAIPAPISVRSHGFRR